MSDWSLCLNGIRPASPCVIWEALRCNAWRRNAVGSRRQSLPPLAMWPAFPASDCAVPTFVVSGPSRQPLSVHARDEASRRPTGRRPPAGSRIHFLPGSSAGRSARVMEDLRRFHGPRYRCIIRQKAVRPVPVIQRAPQGRMRSGGTLVEAWEPPAERAGPGVPPVMRRPQSVCGMARPCSFARSEPRTPPP
jgi:hypothetical protein